MPNVTNFIVNRRTIKNYFLDSEAYQISVKLISRRKTIKNKVEMMNSNL